jgi:hypothetical protein
MRSVFPFYNETQTFSVTINVQLVSTFEHTQLVRANMGFWCDEECSLSTFEHTQPVFDGYQLLNIPNQCLMGINF